MEPNPITFHPGTPFKISSQPALAHHCGGPWSRKRQKIFFSTMKEYIIEIKVVSEMDRGGGSQTCPRICSGAGMYNLRKRCSLPQETYPIAYLLVPGTQHCLSLQVQSKAASPVADQPSECCLPCALFVQTGSSQTGPGTGVGYQVG